MAYGTVNADVIGTSVAGSNLGAGNASIMKNRIINGAMVIDQRNAGASVAGNNVYTLDRWYAFCSNNSKFNVQQNAGSVTPPTGYTNYLGVTSSAATTVAATDYYGVFQAIEGFNIADLGWGTANAKTVTLSFQVYSSLTGTFGGSLRNSANTRSYPFTYSIPVANTWTSISVTVIGDTTGTWLSNNGTGINLNFGLGVGSTYSGTAGSWAGANYIGATGATSVVGTNGATFYITGVQLEVGSSATGFEYVNYQTSLANCQRYFETYTAAGNNSGIAVMNSDSTTTGRGVYFLRVQKRTNPSVTFAAGSNFLYQGANINSATGTPTLATSSPISLLFDVTTFSKIQWATANLLENSSAGTVLFAISAEL
jgi:hypothetical protein